MAPAPHRTGATTQWTDIVIDHSGYEDPALKSRKAERNLRLLLLDQVEHPDEPFILFNLGWAYMEVGRPEDALALLERSRALSHARESGKRGEMHSHEGGPSRGWGRSF